MKFHFFIFEKRFLKLAAGDLLRNRGVGGGDSSTGVDSAVAFTRASIVFLLDGRSWEGRLSSANRKCLLGTFLP